MKKALNRFIDIMGCVVGGTMIWNYFPVLDTASGVVYFVIGVFLLLYSMLRIIRNR